MSAQQIEIPHVDARQQKGITDEQAKFFLDNGFLVVKNVLQGKELAIVQQEMQALFDKGRSEVVPDEDYAYSKGVKSGRKVLKRIEYVIDKSDPMKALLGHPFILHSVEKLQGQNFIPTWDSMVVKVPDEGVIVPWHRDAAVPAGCTDPRPIFNVDFYLDEADLKTCLWVIPGSNRWREEEARQRCSRPGFDTSDAIPVPMQPGDVIFHDITVIHGSPDGDGNAQRRTVYYEFRPGEIEAGFGPHTQEYITFKQHVLLDCIARRSATAYAADEETYAYRYPHQSYWLER
ncbi:phytanoyl-CoA dioxygenase [Paenibacillaceae bacterium]|nr:phytanoyl-CoA dioxygenase [Paenibacillaceae bacterium]